MERLNYYDSNIKFDRKALTEVWKILNQYEDDIEEIPEKYMWLIEDNMDKDYDFDIENIQYIRDDTKKIITFIYTNYLSTPEERTVLKQFEQIQYKEKMKKEYTSNMEMNNSLFKDRGKEKEAEKEQDNQNMNSNLPIERKESIFTNILNKIKDFFRNIFGR